MKAVKLAIFAHPLEKVKLAVADEIPLLLQRPEPGLGLIETPDESVNVDGARRLVELEAAK